MKVKPHNKNNRSPSHIFGSHSSITEEISQWLNGELETRKAGIVLVQDDNLLDDPAFSSSGADEIHRWIILFEGLPIDPGIVQRWRNWAMDRNAIDLKLAMAKKGQVNQESLKAILASRPCAEWATPTPPKEDAAIEIGRFVKMPNPPAAKDDSSLLTMMFGSMGELLTQLEIIAKRFSEVCADAKFDASKQKQLQDAVEKRLALDKPGERDLKAPESGLENLIDHFPKVLLHGDSGVGKTLVASYLQSRASSTERRPLRIPIPEYLGKEEAFEYDFFGYATGNYTGGRDTGSSGKLIRNVGGVIFLDEIGEANLTIQSKLLAFLDDYRVCPRGWEGEYFHCPVLIVAATNKNLNEMAKKKKFKGDLLARFTDHLSIPPLRERMVDIEFILDCLLQRESLNPDAYVQEIGSGALAAIKEQKFDKGNFRELEDWFRTACAKARREQRQYLVAGDVRG
jgi:hypothetical protein